MNLRRKGIVTFFLIVAVCWFSSVLEQVSAAERVKVALILAQTGIAAKDNGPALEGAKIAVEEINSVLLKPVRMYIDLVILDNNSTAIGSKIAAEKAASMHVSGAIGPLWSSQALAAAAVLQKAGIPMITPTGTKPEITRVGSYIFRACITDSFQGKVMAHYAAVDLKARTASVLINMNEEYSMGLAEYFTRHFSQYGGKVVYTGNYQGTAVDFKEQISKMMELAPDVVFIPGYARDSGLIIKQAISLGMKTVFLGGDGWDNSMFEYAGNLIDGGYYTTMWHPDVPFPQSRVLQARYRKKYAKPCDDMRVPLTYDAFMLLATAIHDARSRNPARIRNALASVHGFKGATGTISFDEHGDPLNKETVILTFKKGSSAFVRSVKP
jgi:branched-chain amino acid transport system substrate-binding protein